MSEKIYPLFYYEIFLYPMLNHLIITLPLMATKQYRGQPWTISLADDDSLLSVPINIWLFISQRRAAEESIWAQ